MTSTNQSLSIDSSKINLQLVINDIQRAIQVCDATWDATDEERKEDYKKEWYYAVGYSRSCMKDVIAHLELIVEELEYGGTDNT